jgi:hypothetical protein
MTQHGQSGPSSDRDQQSRDATTAPTSQRPIPAEQQSTLDEAAEKQAMEPGGDKTPSRTQEGRKS